MAEVFHFLRERCFLGAGEALRKRPATIQGRPHSLLGRWSGLFGSRNGHEPRSRRLSGTGGGLGGHALAGLLPASRLSRGVETRPSLFRAHLGGLVQRLRFREHFYKKTVGRETLLCSQCAEAIRVPSCQYLESAWQRWG